MRRVNDLDKFVATFLGSYKQSADEGIRRERNQLDAANLAFNRDAMAKRLEIAENNSNALAQHYQNMDANSQARINTSASNGQFSPQFADWYNRHRAEFEGDPNSGTPTNTPPSTTAVPDRNVPSSALPPNSRAAADVTDPVTETVPFGELVDEQAKGGLVKHPFHHIAGEAMQGIQERYALHAATGGAVPSIDQRRQLDAFHANSGAISPEAYDALRQKTGSVEGSLRGLYDFYASKGDKGAAREAASGVMEAARARSMELGQQALGALDQQDYPAAAKSLMAAYSEVPDDHTFTGEVNPNGVGRAVIRNNATGKPVQELDLNPQILANAAKTMAAGSGFYPHMAMAIKSAQPVQHAFSGGLMDQGVDAAMDDEDEDLLQPAVAEDDSLPSADLASSDGSTPSAIPQDTSRYRAIPPEPWMNRRDLQGLAMLNRERELNFKAASSNSRIKERADASVTAHQENKYNDSPEGMLAYRRAQLEKQYGNDKRKLNEGLSDLGVQYYAATNPNIKPGGFKPDPDDPEGQTRYARYIAPFTAELDAIENLAAKEANQKRDDGTPMVDPTKRATRKLDDAQRAELLDIANNVYGYTGKSPRQIVRALHQLAFNPEVEVKRDPRTMQYRVAGITLPLSSSDFIALNQLNNKEKKRYQMEKRINASNARLAPEVEAQFQRYYATRGKNSIRNDAGIASDGTLPNFGELPGFDPEARLGVR